MKSFHACRQLFEEYKRERSVPFFYYDMNHAAQSKQYFDKLMEYQINYREWETIIKKINAKESGLSDLFADCRDEKGLVEKWFLDAVEHKLSKDRNRMKEFQSIMEKYVAQYRDNQSKMERRDTIRTFEQEAERIRRMTLDYRDRAEEQREQEQRIADFIRQLHQMNEREQEHAASVAQRMDELKQQLFCLEYEKLSKELYQIMDSERECGSRRNLLELEKEDLERAGEEISRKLHALACAKQQENVAEAEEERERERQRLALCRKREENSEPERKRLGGRLGTYYDMLGQQKTAEKNRCADAIDRMEKEREEEQRKQEELRKQDGLLSEEAGAFRAKLRAYDDEEERFNRQYQENWSRNILGEYEAGALQIRQAEYEKQLQQTEHERGKAKKEAEQYRDEWKARQRRMEEQTAAKIRHEAEKKESERRLSDYETELSERRSILPYFDLTQAELFDSEKILAAAERKLTDTDLALQGLLREADVLEREYRKLAQGQILELTEDFKAMLDEAGIHYVYGMEWLKKNQYPAKKNRQLVREHPFLPYSLILSGQEMKRLSSLSDQVYTSSPIPLLLREELEDKEAVQEGAVCSFERFSFYVWFNDNLLDEEKLGQMLSEKAAQLGKLQKSIGQKKQEYADYIGRREKIRSQKVTQSAYEQLQEEIRRQEQEEKNLEQELLKQREVLEQTKLRITQAEERGAGLERERLYQSGRLAEFLRMCQSYQEYRENSRLLEKNRKEKERILNRQRLVQEKIDRLTQELITVGNELIAVEREQRECAQKQIHYRQYADGQTDLPEVLTAEQAKKAESRYEAITSGINAEQKELEQRVETAEMRYARAREELESLQKKYGLLDGTWMGVRYERQEEQHQEALLEAQKKKLADKERGIHSQEIEYALVKQKRESKCAELKERCGREEPIAREKISTIDFTEAVRTLEYSIAEVSQQEKDIQKKLLAYESILTALAEYEEFTCTQPVVWECNLSAMTGVELSKQKGILIRDYHACIERRRDARAKLERMLQQVLRTEAFAEDFYRKPLEAMLQLTEDAERVLRQLETTLASYSSLMEKLLVDISLVEREKEKIAELLGDYLKEVHENLNKIDHNSTITIRERPVKMLKIELPDWTENESFYELRLGDTIDDITAKSLALLEENKNVQEYLGTRITTKGLYDAVVGIGNVQIRLYKIEEQREYPITWAQVAGNSGGEGFLSAFVILSSLLCYMRREDADLFADRNEGKVLLMDNPFAQTNASHLLRPLMDMAKKTNTQLICLSGLGGESIYSCFDNIYVLTLVAASLRNDMQYLKADHRRGSEEETMLLSQIEVIQEL